MDSNTAKTIADTTRSQIRPMDLMACGARNFSYDKNGKLTFKVGGRMRWVEITLDASDTYTVELVRITRKYDRVIVNSASDVYCDMLSATVYAACNK